METGFYTLNHVNTSIFKQAHQSSARYPQECSEFTATQLSPIYEENFPAPFVKESTVKIGMKVEECNTLSINNTVLVIGSIQKVLITDEQIIQTDGFLDLEQAGTLTSSGLDSYHKTTLLARLPYAKAK